MSENVNPAAQLTERLPRIAGWRLMPRFASLTGQTLNRRLLHLLGLRQRAVIEAADCEPPDSLLCRRATEMVAGLAPLFLLNHSVRSYVFGAALGRRDGRRFDRELLYLACVMHDLGLTPAHSGPDAFELQGARAARKFMLDQGASPAQAALVHEAIALHARVGEATRREPEVALVHLGAGMDVIGLRAEDFSAEAVERALVRWPREGFKRCFPPLVRQEAERKPATNIAGHVSLGFLERIASAPFAD